MTLSGNIKTEKEILVHYRRREYIRPRGGGEFNAPPREKERFFVENDIVSEYAISETISFSYHFAFLEREFS